MPSRVTPNINALAAIQKRLLEMFPEGGAGGAVPYLQVYHEAGHLAEGARALDELRAARNPSETESAHIKRVSAAAQKYAKEIDATLGRVNKIVRDGLAHIEGQITAKTRLTPDAHASEVRAVYRSMSSKDQLALLTALVEENRGPEFAAIIKAPRSTTGMQEDQRHNFETVFIAKHAPKELIDKKALNEALETANVAIQTAREVASAFDDPAKVAEIVRAEAAAAEAAKKFDATVRT